MLMTCPSCQQQVESGGAFCDNCGSKLPGVGAAPAAAPGVVAPGACSACGFVNVPGESYCANCGVQLAPVSVVPPPPPAPMPGPVPTPPVFASPAVPQPPQYVVGGIVTGRLVAQATNSSIAIPPGKAEIIIGRADPVSNVFPDVDLTPFDAENAGVSRRHARIVAQGMQMYVEDLGSTNFTVLNKNKLQPGQSYPLNNGDEVRFGRLIFNYYA